MTPKPEHVAYHPEFIRFVQASKDAAEFKQMPEPILMLNILKRKAVVDTWLNQLHFQRASLILITSLSRLFDDVAVKTLEILQG